MKRIGAAALLALFAISQPSFAQGLKTREGWMIIHSAKSYEDLVSAVKSATAAAKFGVVTDVGPTGAAKARGITIPGNRVIGVFRNDYAVDILQTSTAAMIEAPIRFYVTEDEDGTATLSYKKPSFVFAPYADEGGARLSELAGELDEIFETIAANATK